MEIERYLETIVDPTIDDLESHPTSVRYAFLACVAVFHSLDYLAHSESSEKQNRRSLFRKQSADFATVDRVAHAFSVENRRCHQAPTCLLGQRALGPVALGRRHGRRDAGR
jgi:hypothetical protein